MCVCKKCVGFLFTFSCSSPRGLSYVSLNHLSPPLHAKISPKINCQRVAQMKKYELKNIVHECVCVCAWVCKHPTCVCSCRCVIPQYAYAAIWQWWSLPCQNTHSRTHTYIPDTQANISVNETGGPLLPRVHTALSVTVTAGEERARMQRVNKIEKGKNGKDRSRGEGEGQRSGGYCSLPLLFPPAENGYLH